MLQCGGGTSSTKPRHRQTSCDAPARIIGTEGRPLTGASRRRAHPVPRTVTVISPPASHGAPVHNCFRSAAWLSRAPAPQGKSCPQTGRAAQLGHAASCRSSEVCCSALNCSRWRAPSASLLHCCCHFQV
ncbi:hypothetical protein WMY93_002939 [Mugilogobius chulae]|uniref:Uncharacterized protein n=1 Tax=Mugilogobius chulae TaxID=88201 RepID=A0AAW0PWU4_9GOBI